MEAIRYILNFECFFSVGAQGAQDGLALLWKYPLDVKVQHYSTHFITAKVYLLTAGINFTFTSIYGEPKCHLRMQFWRDFGRIAW